MLSNTVALDISDIAASCIAPGSGLKGFMARLRSACAVPKLLYATESEIDRKSTRLNSSHLGISYAVFCLKKKKTKDKIGIGIPYSTARPAPHRTTQCA